MISSFLLIIVFQKDGTFIFNLEDFIPKLCLLAQEVGEDERGFRLRAVGLQTLSSMVIALFYLLFFVCYLSCFK